MTIKYKNICRIFETINKFMNKSFEIEIIINKHHQNSECSKAYSIYYTVYNATN